MYTDILIESQTHDEWLQYSNSLWDGRRIDVVKKIINLFTDPEEIVLDPFMGTGYTLVAANTLDRMAIGFEINKKYITTADERLKIYKDSYQIIKDSCININKYLYEESVDLCVTSPPCWNILSHRHIAYKKHKETSSVQRNIGNTNSYSLYLNNLTRAFSGVYEVLKANKMCIVIASDRRKRNRFYPLHIDLTNIMTDIGFTLEDLIIWDRRKEHSILKAVDNSCIYKSNIVHEYICIFRKITKESRIL
ncbi:MAG: site-specific DNA-methyltransferase [Clostridiales bacterium]|nr:site-specific DNA-methyltransferase [Clostridiales bacterium]